MIPFRRHRPDFAALVAGIALAAPGLVVGTPVQLSAQDRSPEVRRHVEAARSAAGGEHVRSFHYLCEVEGDPPRESAAPAAPEGRPEWYAPPARVFDNLYFVGTRSLNAWAVTTSQGIVVIDPLYHRMVETAVIEGLRSLGLDPEDISHVLVSHGHADHYGGARELQDRFGARVVLSAADWDLVLEDDRDEPKPTRDVEVTGDRVLEVGDTRLTLVLTPGHTPGSISTLLPVRDGARRHVAALWGGTAMRESREAHRQYAASARAFAERARAAGADVLISNHDIFDEAHRKMAALERRGPGDPHPFVIGPEATIDYFEMLEHCAAAGLARLGAGAR